MSTTGIQETDVKATPEGYFPNVFNIFSCFLLLGWLLLNHIKVHLKLKPNSLLFKHILSCLL